MQDWLEKIHVGDVSDVLRLLPAQSVHCVVTSPPYYRQRTYEMDGQIGLEATGETYVERIVEVFRRIRRVLRKDGCLFLNLGDGYIGGGRGEDTGSTLEGGIEHQAETRKVAPNKGVFGLKEKQLILMPHRLALALQADGWWVRQDNIWFKSNVTPSSCKDRTTRTHEYVFQMNRSSHYFYDAIAVEEPQSERERAYRLRQQTRGVETMYTLHRDDHHGQERPGKTGAVRSAAARQVLALKGTRNKRSVWKISTQPLKERFYAAFPEKLVEPCILAGTSEKGCCTLCGTPWKRQVRPTEEYGAILKANLGANNLKTKEEEITTGHRGMAIHKNGGLGSGYRTVGWDRSCGCQLGGTAPCIVLDPFMGSGTTAVVAERLGRKWVGIELNPRYAQIAERRIQRAREKRMAREVDANVQNY
jgi:DNA modification methylase